LEGALYAVGGQHANMEEILSVVEQWQPETNQWQNVASLPDPKAFFGLTVAGDKCVTHTSSKLTSFQGDSTAV